MGPHPLVGTNVPEALCPRCAEPDVAELIVLSSPQGLSAYRPRYDDFPEPVWASRGGPLPKLWLRGDVEAWTDGRRAG